jgi:hypothetical protein
VIDRDLGARSSAQFLPRPLGIGVRIRAIFRRCPSVPALVSGRMRSSPPWALNIRITTDDIVKVLDFGLAK